MKILVTGGAGFIGSHVVDALIEKGNEVVVIDNLSAGRLENVNKNAKFYWGDIKDTGIKEVFEKEKFEVVFHLAAQINVRESLKNPGKDAETNIIGTLNLLNSCVEHNVKKIIFSSSGGAIYSDEKIPADEESKEKPLSPYGIAKWAIEKYLEFYKNVHGLDYVALRYSNVYGPRQNSKGEAGVCAIFIDKLLNGQQTVINGSGEQTRDYVFVKDVAAANVLALKLSGIFNVSTGKETSVNQLFREMIDILEVKADEIHALAIKGEQQRSCLNSDKLRREGWKGNYGLNIGLRETIKWFKNKK
jgi:UDP-glucose 4-epimerase